MGTWPTRWMTRVLTAMVVMTLAVTGCGDGKGTTAGNQDGGGLGAPDGDGPASGGARGITDDTILLGAVVDFTGPFAAATPLFQAGIDAWVTEVGDSIGGRRFEVVYEDGRGDPSTSQTAATKLIEDDGVFALVTVLGSSAAAAVAQVAADSDVIMFPAAPADPLYIPTQRNVFVIPVPYQAQMARAVEGMVEETGGAKIGAVVSSDEFGESGMVGVDAAVEHLSLELTTEETFERGAQDMRSQAQGLAASEPDFGVCVCTFAQSSLLVRELDRMGETDLPVVAPSPTVGAPLFELLGDVDAELYATDFVSHAGTPGWDEAAAAVMATEGHEPDSLELLGSLTNMAVLAEALAQADGLTTAGVIAALEGFQDEEIPGLAVTVTFGPDRHVASFASGLYQADVAGRTWTLVGDVVEPETPGVVPG